MALYIEGLLWYLLLLDVILYAALSWNKKLAQKYQTHWLSAHLPPHQFFAVIYLLLVLWLGFALQRMNLLTLI